MEIIEGKEIGGARVKELTFSQLIKLYEILESHQDELDSNPERHFDYEFKKSRKEIAFQIAEKIQQGVR